MNPRSRNQWDTFNLIIKPIDTRIDLQSQTTDIYNIKHMYPSKENCSYVGMYFVKSCGKIMYPEWFG